MKTIVVILKSCRFPVFAACLFAGGTLPAQDTAADSGAPTAVDLKERQQAEEALKQLHNSAQNYFRTLGERQKTAPTLSAPLVLDLPAAEEMTLTAPRRLSLARETKAEFIEPDVIRSHDGQLRAVLKANYADGRIGNDPVHLRMFNGKLVGPTLRVKPGDKIRLLLQNELPGERWFPNMMNALNSFNTMNIHYHGLHVSPDGISDNVLIQVGPHESQQYEVDIPANHTPGTYWYHPHRHGSTAGDVASSLSGALIIEGGLDDIPEIKAARERILVLNQIPYIYKNCLPDPKSNANPPPIVHFDLPAGVVELKYAAYIFGPGDWAPLGRYTTVNGAVLPEIHMHPGEIERWRIIDSGQREMVMLKVVPDPQASGPATEQIVFNEIAEDGLPLGKIVQYDKIELWPGYRSDVLVQAPKTAGSYFLIDDAVSAPNAMNGGGKPLSYIAHLVIEGGPRAMKLPSDHEMAGLRLPPVKDSELTGKQTATYGINAAGNVFVFTIDGKSFSMETARTLDLNGVEEWTISSVNNVGLVTHPFHIHVNPFEVTSIMAPDGSGNLTEQLKAGPVWKDTVKIPGGGHVTMRTRYQDFVGTFVQHCHILDHEDQGMMQLIDIVDPKAKPVVDLTKVPTVGSEAPDFVLNDAEGKPHSLAETGGKPAVVFFFKGHGCLHCAQQVAAFTAHYGSFARQGIQVIGITSDEEPVLKAALASYPCPFLLLADPHGVAFGKYGCTSTNDLLHGSFCLDSSHRVKWRTVGGSPYLTVENLPAELAAVPSAERSPAASGQTAPAASAVASADPDIAGR